MPVPCLIASGEHGRDSSNKEPMFLGPNMPRNILQRNVVDMNAMNTSCEYLHGIAQTASILAVIMDDLPILSSHLTYPVGVGDGEVEDLEDYTRLGTRLSSCRDPPTAGSLSDKRRC